MQCHSMDISSEICRVISAIEEFDGACDPTFDNGLEELERQFAELRLQLASDLN
jgi:hypothetical protein